MTIKPIRTNSDLRAALHRLEGNFQADEGTPEAAERDVLVTLIEAYEYQHYTFGPAARLRPSNSGWNSRGRRHAISRPALGRVDASRRYSIANGQSAFE